MEIKSFNLPSGKRRFHIDDHEIITGGNGLDSLLDRVTVSDEARLIVRIEALRIEMRELTDKHRELMWKITKIMESINNGYKL